MKKIFVVLMLLLGASFSSIADNPSLGYEKFGHLPMVTKARVSPDGKLVVAVLNNEEGPSVVVSPFGTKDLNTIVRLKKSQDLIEKIYWLNNERLMIEASYSAVSSGTRYRQSRFFAVNFDGSELKEIKRKYAKGTPYWEQNLELRLLSILPDNKDHILIQMHDRNDNATSVFKVNVYTNGFDKQFANKYDVYHWSTNKVGDVLFGYGRDRYDHSNETTVYWARESVEHEWKLIKKRKAFDTYTFSPMLVENGKVFVMSTYQTGRESLWLFDLKTGEFDSLVYGHEEYDIDRVIFNSKRTEIIGVRYYEHYLKNHFLDEDKNNIFKMVQNSFKGYETSIASWSEDNKQILVWAQKDNSPSKYFWLDVDKRAGSFWFSQYPYLEGKKLGNKSPISFKARDGMQLHGYLAMPANVGKKKPKLVVYPHGGPLDVRDNQSFDPYVQYMTNLGYAVLQVNFRGSGGYGVRYLTNGYREWGKKMQTDVYDAVGWLTEQGNVDTKNTCMVGGSYGGYVALTAAFQKANAYQCIVSIAGIPDLYTLAYDDMRHKGGLRAHVRETIGDPNVDEIAKELKQYSATNNLHKIKAPILLIHGARDSRVDVSQSRDFYEKSKKAGLDIEYVELKYGSHFLDENDDRLTTFEALGDFLQEHLD
jgi:dipeptidyl aminopeptidase/acylaminoacyl peptidase